MACVLIGGSPPNPENHFLLLEPGTGTNHPLNW